MGSGFGADAGGVGLPLGEPPVEINRSVAMAPMMVTTGSVTCFFLDVEKADENRNTSRSSPCKDAEPTMHFFSSRVIYLSGS